MADEQLNTSIIQKDILSLNKGNIVEHKDSITIEEPIEMILEYGPKENRTKSNIAITMRTPGDDNLLLTGFLFTEGIISNYNEVIEIIQLKSPLSKNYENRILAKISSQSKFKIDKLSRHLFTSSSCGVCGKTSIDNLKTVIPTINENKLLPIASNVLHTLPKQLMQDQSLFNQTGSIHAAAIFTFEGKLIEVKEDVGRHNALDKLIGWSLANNFSSLQDHLILLSGRISFELVQKALMAGCKTLAAIGAPSSAAVELADEYNMTLIGFLSENRFNIYTHNNRIQIESSINKIEN